MASEPPHVRYIHAIDAKSDTWAALNASSKVEHFWDNAWWEIYKTEPISHYGDLWLVIDQFALGPTSGPISHTTSMLSSEYLPNVSSWEFFSAMNPNNSLPWIEYQHFYRSEQQRNSLWPRAARVAQSFATIIVAPSRIQLSRDFMLATIFFGLLKLIIMLCVLAADRSDYLVTLGDALGSYLQQPDPMTEGKCMLDKAGHRFISGERVDLEPELDDRENFHRRVNGTWVPRRLRFSMLLRKDRQQIFVIL